MKYVIITPGGTVQYDVPVMRVQKYSLEDIFAVPTNQPINQSINQSD